MAWPGSVCSNAPRGEGRTYGQHSSKPFSNSSGAPRGEARDGERRGPPRDGGRDNHRNTAPRGDGPARHQGGDAPRGDRAGHTTNNDQPDQHRVIPVVAVCLDKAQNNRGGGAGHPPKGFPDGVRQVWLRTE